MDGDPVGSYRFSAAPARGGRHAAGRRPREGAEDEAAHLLTSLVAARAGSLGAFETIYRVLTPRLRRYARALVGQDADDVLAEAWLQIVRDLDHFDGDWDTFRGWTTRIVRNRAIDHLRATARRPLASDLTELLAHRAAPQDTAIAAEEAMSTAAALELVSMLPPDQAEAVLLRTVLGLDAKTAGAVLGKRPGAVRVATHRGLKNLAQLLDDTTTPRPASNAFGASDAGVVT